MEAIGLRSLAFVVCAALLLSSWDLVATTGEEDGSVPITHELSDPGSSARENAPRPLVNTGPQMNPKKLWEIKGWSTPEIGRGMVFGNYFVTDDDGGVHRMRLMNGTRVWDVTLPGPVTQPFLWDDNILTTADTFYALNIEDGSVNYSHAVKPERPSQLYLRQLDAWYTIGDRVVKLYTDNGTIQWISPPIAPGIGGPSAGDCCATAMQVYKQNRIYTIYFLNGSLQYIHDMPGVIYGGKIPVFNTYIYAGDSTGTFRAVQDIDGVVGWETKLGHGASIAPWIDKNDMIGATVDGYVYDINLIDGSVQWTVQLPAEARSQPEILYGHSFFGAEDGRVYGVNLATRQVDVTIDFGVPVRGRLATFSGILLVPGVDRIAAFDLYPAEFKITSHANGSYVPSSRIELKGYGLDDHFLNGVQFSLDGQNWLQVGPQGIRYENLGHVSRLNWNSSLDLKPGWNTVHARLIGVIGTERVYYTDTIELFLDEEAPELVIVDPSDGLVTSSRSITLTGTASDPNGLVTVEASPEMYAWKQATGLENWTVDLELLDGTYDLAVRAIDRAGRTSIASVTVTVLGKPPDTIPPSISVEAGAPILYRRESPATIAGSASDNGPMRRVDASPDGAEWRRCFGTNVWTCHLMLASGANDVRFRAMDTYNNTSEVTAVVVLDTTPPTLDVSHPPPVLVTNQRTIVAKGSFDDDHTLGVVVANSSRVMTVSTNVVNRSWELSFELPDGTEHIRFTAIDAAQNMVVVIRNVTLDLVVPRLKLDYWQRGPEGVKLFGSAADDGGVAKIEARGDGGPWQAASGTQSWFVTVPGDPAIIEVRVTDLAGNDFVETIVTRSGLAAGDYIGGVVAMIGLAALLLAVVFILIRRRNARKSARRRAPVDEKAAPPSPRA